MIIEDSYNATAEQSEDQSADDGIISIIIADDHPMMRKTLRDIFFKEHDLQIVAEAIDGVEVVELVTRFNPDLVIMDIAMPKLNGIEATRQIIKINPKTLVLVLTVHDDNEHILSILEAGAAGYLTKSILGKEIPKAVRSVMAGETILSKEVFQRVLKHALQYPSKPVSKDAITKITLRELDIIRLAAEGISNKNIALRLSLSERTVKNYFSNIFSKLGVSSRTEAVTTAVRLGIIRIDNVDG